LKKAVTSLVLGGALVLGFQAGGWAAAQATDAAQAKRFTLAFTERVRQETSDNVASLRDSGTDSSAYIRFRTSLMGRWRPASSFELTVRLTNENRYYFAPKSDPRLHKDFDLHEVFFDYLYFKWKDPFGMYGTLTLGRQDLQFGEGFLIMDGGPLDGSRSAYFNAARMDWESGTSNRLTAFYMYQPRTDTLLPVLNDVGQPMLEQAEEGFGVYAAGAAGSAAVEGYLFRKNVRAFESVPASGITNFGGRVAWPFTPEFSLTAEGAFQLGRLAETRRRGLGGYFHLDWKTNASFPLPAQLTLGGIHLSGDDPGTSDRYEGWDPAFSRWPKWSESLIYLFARESRPAYWTNFVSLYGTLNFAVTANAKLALTWHHLSAAERTSATAFLSGTGTKRGDLGIVKLTYDISPNLQGHFLWEQFRPGDFYFAGAQSYAWVRFELLVRD
jgi:hypothetical protein